MRYLLIQTAVSCESDSVSALHALAADLVQEGNEVSLMLIGLGVLAGQRPEGRAMLSSARRAGVEVVLDEHSVRAHGIAVDELLSGVRIERYGTVVDRATASGGVVMRQREA